MTLQAALAAVFLLGLPLLLLALGVLAHAYYVARPRNAARAGRLIEELVAESVDQLIAQLRSVPRAASESASQPALEPAFQSALRPALVAPESHAAHAFGALAPAAPRAPVPGPLSNLRAAVGQLLIEGLSDRSIARRLGIGIEEVRAARGSGETERSAA